MKKVVLTYGLISGVLVTGLMLAGLPFLSNLDFRTGEILGYSSIVLAALLVFFGVRSYRENAGAGKLTFGRGFAVGLLITLVSAGIYVATWETLYYGVIPGLGDKLAACMVEKVKATGAPQDKIDEAAKRAAAFKTMYDNPLANVALTFIEPFPIGLVVTALSAAILRRK